MAFVRRKGRTKFVSLPVTVSTALSANSIVAFSSGRLIAATTTSNIETHAGVLLKAIAATDSDYATTRNVLVEVPLEPTVEWEADMTAIVVGDVGLYMDLASATTGGSTGATTYNPLRITKYISATKAWVNILMHPMA